MLERIGLTLVWLENALKIVGDWGSNTLSSERVGVVLIAVGVFGICWCSAMATILVFG